MGKTQATHYIGELQGSGVAFEPNFAPRIARRRTQNKERFLGVRPFLHPPMSRKRVN